MLQRLPPKLKLSFCLQQLDAKAAQEYARLSVCDKASCKQLVCANAFPECSLIGSGSIPVCTTLCRSCYASCAQDASRTACELMIPAATTVKRYSASTSCSMGLGNTSVVI
jgi:hypothetical protein